MSVNLLIKWEKEKSKRYKDIHPFICPRQPKCASVHFNSLPAASQICSPLKWQTKQGDNEKYCKAQAGISHRAPRLPASLVFKDESQIITKATTFCYLCGQRAESAHAEHQWGEAGAVLARCSACCGGEPHLAFLVLPSNWINSCPNAPYISPVTESQNHRITEW